MNLEYNKGILFVRLPKKVSRELSKSINIELVPKILKQKIKYIVLNLYEVDEIDEFGLDALLNVKCAIRANKGKICLCEVKDNIKSDIKKIKMLKVNNELNALDMIGTI